MKGHTPFLLVKLYGLQANGSLVDVTKRIIHMNQGLLWGIWIRALSLYGFLYIKWCQEADKSQIQRKTVEISRVKTLILCCVERRHSGDRTRLMDVFPQITKNTKSITTFLKLDLFPYPYKMCGGHLHVLN